MSLKHGSAAASAAAIGVPPMGSRSRRVNGTMNQSLGLAGRRAADQCTRAACAPRARFAHSWTQPAREYAKNNVANAAHDGRTFAVPLIGALAQPTPDGFWHSLAFTALASPAKSCKARGTFPAKRNLCLDPRPNSARSIVLYPNRVRSRSDGL